MIPGIISFWKSSAMTWKSSPFSGAVSARDNQFLNAGIGMQPVVRTGQGLPQIPWMDLRRDRAFLEGVEIVANPIDGLISGLSESSNNQLDASDRESLMKRGEMVMV